MGECKGKKVQDVKKTIQTQLVKQVGSTRISCVTCCRVLVRIGQFSNLPAGPRPGYNIHKSKPAQSVTQRAMVYQQILSGPFLNNDRLKQIYFIYLPVIIFHFTVILQLF